MVVVSTFVFHKAWIVSVVRQGIRNGSSNVTSSMLTIYWAFSRPFLCTDVQRGQVPSKRQRFKRTVHTFTTTERVRPSNVPNCQSSSDVMTSLYSKRFRRVKITSFFWYILKLFLVLQMRGRIGNTVFLFALSTIRRKKKELVWSRKTCLGKAPRNTNTKSALHSL